MSKFLKCVFFYLVGIASYFVVATALASWGISSTWIAGMKDGIWMLGIIILVASYPRETWRYLQTTYRLRCALWVMIAIGIGVTVAHQPLHLMTDMIIWLKYGVYYMIILLSAGLIGYVVAIHSGWPQLVRFFALFRIVCIVIIVVGLIRQGAKMLVPDRYIHLGYGPVGDRVDGTAPPLYYRTGPGGWMRLSWLFAWPNNYGFRLVGIIPFLLLTSPIKSPKYYKLFLVILIVVSLVALLGRGVIIGLIPLIIVMMRRHWVRFSSFFIGWCGIGIAMIFVLTRYKWWSTLAHRNALRSSLSTIVSHPRWLWLGTSWPWVHRNGNILPENYYLQLIVDFGMIPFVVRCGFRWKFFTLQPCDTTKSDLSAIYFSLVIWLIWLACVWGVLHVFEDSMTNYLIMVPLWMVRGYFLFAPQYSKSLVV